MNYEMNQHNELISKILDHVESMEKERNGETTEIVVKDKKFILRLWTEQGWSVSELPLDDMIILSDLLKQLPKEEWHRVSKWTVHNSNPEMK